MLKVQEAKTKLTKVTPIKGDSSRTSPRPDARHGRGARRRVRRHHREGRSLPRCKKGDGLLTVGGGRTRRARDDRFARTGWGDYFDEAERNRGAVAASVIVRTAEQNDGQIDPRARAAAHRPGLRPGRRRPRAAAHRRTCCSARSPSPRHRVPVPPRSPPPRRRSARHSRSWTRSTKSRSSRHGIQKSAGQHRQRVHRSRTPRSAACWTRLSSHSPASSSAPVPLTGVASGAA